MAETSVSLLLVPSALGILLAGWASSLVLYVLGAMGRKPAMVGAGLIVAGIMVLVTGALVYLTTLPAAPRGYDASSADLLALGLIGFLGGALAMLGASYVAFGAGRAAAARAP